MLPVEISHRTILACRDTLAAGLSTRRSGSFPVLDSELGALPEGVRAMVTEGYPHIVEELDPLPVEELHREAVAMAWAEGAWDIRVLRHPPLPEMSLGGIAKRRFASERLLDALLEAALRGRLVQWDWRPMRSGPRIRIGAHAHKDVTLDADHGRSGLAPDTLRSVNWAGQGGCDIAIRLGRLTLDVPEPTGRTPYAGPEARATPKQRGYIIALRHHLGRFGEPLPARLTRREASAIIDDLTSIDPA